MDYSISITHPDNVIGIDINDIMFITKDVGLNINVMEECSRMITLIQQLFITLLKTKVWKKDITRIVVIAK